MPLAECAAVAFELDCSPVRGFPAFRGQGNYPGLWWFSTTREHGGYESWSERDHLIALDADPASVYVREHAYDFSAMPPARHRAYAFQWFFFAAVAVTIYLLALRRRAPKLPPEP